MAAKTVGQGAYTGLKDREPFVMYPGATDYSVHSVVHCWLVATTRSCGRTWVSGELYVVHYLCILAILIKPHISTNQFQRSERSYGLETAEGLTGRPKIRVVHNFM